MGILLYVCVCREWTGVSCASNTEGSLTTELRGPPLRG